MGAAPTRRVLIVEDDAFLAMDLEMMLGDAGYGVAGPARTAAEGLAAIDEGGIDAALIDLNLGEGDSEAIADRLAAEGIPFAYVTGHAADALPAAHRQRPLLSKPVGEPALRQTLDTMIRAGDI
ncbi:MAG: response regulator [Acuticoccus sp.]